MSTTRDWRPGFEQQTARINTNDDTWRRFRQLCLDNGEHVSDVLGRLVEHEVNRQRPPARGPAIDTPPPKRVNASTREQAGKTTPSTRARPATSTTETRGTTEVLSLFDRPAGDAPYT